MADEATAAASDDAAAPSDDRTAAEFREVADALRARVDLFGKTLAAVATLGTTAVGLTKVGDLFPADGWDWVWVVVACLALAAAGLMAIWVAVRLMRVSRPVFISPNLDVYTDLDSEERTAVDVYTDLDPEERKAVEPVLEAAARQFGYTSLVGLEQRERALRTAAALTSDPDERTRRQALADQVKAAISRALAQAQVVVVRRRSAQVVSDPLAWKLYGAVIAGLIVFAAGTDYVKSDRTDRVAEAKACGDARTAKATPGELERTNGVCDAAAAEPEADAVPTVAEARATIASQLTATLEACAALVEGAGDADEESGPLRNQDCDPVREAIGTLDPPVAGGG